MFKICRTTYEDLKSKVQEELCESVAVPRHLLGFVIGKKGITIKKIQTQSGARIETNDQSEGEHVGFKVHGTEKEVERAVELINEKVVSTTLILSANALLCLAIFFYVR